MFPLNIAVVQKKSSSELKAVELKRFAVATKSGMLVDQHFGQVSEFLYL